MSQIYYNYFVSCWKINENFTEDNLNNAVKKGYITEGEKEKIMSEERHIMGG